MSTSTSGKSKVGVGVIVGVGVMVGDGVMVGVFVLVGVLVRVAVGTGVGVKEAVGLSVQVAVCVTDGVVVGKLKKESWLEQPEMISNPITIIGIRKAAERRLIGSDGFFKPIIPINSS